MESSYSRGVGQSTKVSSRFYLLSSFIPARKEKAGEYELAFPGFNNNAGLIDIFSA
jgi:hypothetical protein